MTEETENPSKDRPSAFPWPPVLLLGAIALAVILGRYLPLPWPGVDDLPARIVGFGIVLIAVLLFAWSAWTFHRHQTTIMPDRGADVLVTDGPFRFRRNPIYIADVLLLVGVSIVATNLWFLIMAPVFAALVTWLAILPEERHLEAKFGDAYREYKARTRRWF